MKCIVGLGNPGLKYQKTRHNVGFMVIDQLAKRNKWTVSKHKFQSHCTIETVGNEQVILLKPQTYMNLSGESVKAVLDFYKLTPEQLLVIYDDLDLPVGKERLRQSGGHGGHNGIRSIIDQLGTKTFNRIRVGIDRPEFDVTVTDYVLGKFSKEQHLAIAESIDRSVAACEAWFNRSFLEVMNDFN
ncbi:aminoacyl-tRNA hydrolase [Amphibacillus marinus]|nr:aminoacyl-tRNA hydrolase [Amphibacillus marinus]